MASAYSELLKNLSTEGIPPEVLAQLASTAGITRDQLTGLMDFRSFSLQLEEALEAVDSAALITVSIDYLQELNLVSGWVVGDIALCSLANFIKEPPHEHSFSGKVSGGTFISLLASDDIDEAKTWIGEIQHKLAQIDVPGMDILPAEHLTLSCGIYMVQPDKKNAGPALTEAKKRMKYAQSEGGDRISTIADQNIDLETSTFDITCKVRRKGSKEWGSVNIIQLNLHGLSFETPEPHMVREVLQIELTFNGNSLKIDGDVAWRRSSSDGAEHPFNIGVKFKPLDTGQEQLLEQLMG